MFVENGYWHFTKALDKAFCDKINKLASSIKPDKATIFAETPKGKQKVLPKKRDSDVKFISDQWIYDAVIPFVRRANENAKWGFDFDWCETAQYTIYGKNQHYGWHIDMANSPYVSNDINYNGKVRKLSCSLLLNNSSEYEGGEFEISSPNPKPEKHRVKPVTKGVRKSLVIWTLGPTFK